MAAGAETTNNLKKMLEKLKLTHLLEIFSREKVTVDVISKFLTREMECLGINDRNIIMSLRLMSLSVSTLATIHYQGGQEHKLVVHPSTVFPSHFRGLPGRRL